MSAQGNVVEGRDLVVERRLQVVIMLAIGAAAGAGSFRHVHDVAATHGQAGWLAWADAVVLELMSVASGLELRRRKRLHEPVAFPSVVMGVSVVLSVSAQVVEAEPSPIGWIAAAIPALGFLVMVKIALARSSGSADRVEGDVRRQILRDWIPALRRWHVALRMSTRRWLFSSRRPGQPLGLCRRRSVG